jgi:hypothetical protein
MSILELAIYGGTSNKRRHDCHWLYPLCSGQKQNYTVGFGAEPDLMENTLK